VEKSHDAVREETLQTLYQFALTDFDFFYDSVKPDDLQTYDSLKVFSCLLGEYSHQSRNEKHVGHQLYTSTSKYHEDIMKVHLPKVVDILKLIVVGRSDICRCYDAICQRCSVLL
jgi:hypothetical protein